MLITNMNRVLTHDFLDVPISEGHGGESAKHGLRHVQLFDAPVQDVEVLYCLLVRYCGQTILYDIHSYRSLLTLQREWLS